MKKPRVENKKTKKKASKKNNGITLIALVITIIVLLILAGVTIAALTGDNGILTQAQKAKTENKGATDLETVKLAVTSGKLENLTEGTEINSSIQNELRKTDSTATVEGEGDDKDITYNGKLYKINITTGTTEETKKFEKPDYNEMMQALKPGDYVKYNTGVGGVGEIMCRVLYDASSEYGLQIVTDACVHDEDQVRWFEVGGFVPAYSREGDPNVEASKQSYNEAIFGLNSEAENYSNKDYVVSARCIGSNPKYKNNETTTTVTYNNYDTKLKGEDKNYETDYEQLVKCNLLNTDEQYWLASRYNEEGTVYSSAGMCFGLRAVDNWVQDLKLYVIGVHVESWSTWFSGSAASYGLRPVFLLRGDLKITGDGTENSPYELGV